MDHNKLWKIIKKEWGTRLYLWRIHVDIWQNQYSIVKLKNKIKLKERKKERNTK